ncbi:transmembrane protein 125-like [Phyllopteryx taeniolatus]|uniref:transmembrane protein 125-like n=1 Tax=Phyllopteryx taeniolatus TaxID=161469 RepID=UPI002AD2243E|nr:transmembrane protein 125-like [Phyllopteryx taeniolatus]
MPEMQVFYQPGQTFHQRPSPYPDLLRQRSPEEQVELWWFREPRQSLLCYCASVALILGLGLGGVAFLSTSGSSVSSEWRLGVGATLCLLSLALLLKQLLSSAIQDTNCVRSRRRIDQLKSGGRADPALILVAGLAVALCGTVLLCATADDGGDVRVSGLVMIAAGLAMALAVVGYAVLVHLKRRREHSRRRTGAGSVRVFCVSGGQADRAGGETASS